MYWVMDDPLNTVSFIEVSLEYSDLSPVSESIHFHRITRNIFIYIKEFVRKRG